MSDVWKSVFVVTVLLSGFAARNAPAQSTNPQSTRTHTWEFSAYVGGANNSPVGKRLGITPDRDHFFIGLGPSLPLLRWHRWLFAYAPEIVPLLLITNNPTYITRTVEGSHGPVSFCNVNGYDIVYGFALSPLGFESHIRFASRWRVYGACAAGVVWFTRDVPVVYSRAFNYTIEFGGGLQWRCRPGLWLKIGYKFHHLSNADTAPNNPGVDGNVFMIGLVREFGRKR